MRNNFSKIAFAAGLIACLSITAFAKDKQKQPPPDNAEQTAKVQKLIKDGVKKNKEEIQKESLSLSLSDKESLYDKNRKKGAGGWAALDFGVGFGLGSYLQGDLIFGITQSTLDFAGWYLLFSGISMISPDIDYCEDETWDAKKCDEQGANVDLYLATSISILVASRIASWIVPFIYQSRYNKTLKSALNSNNFSYSIEPLLIPKEGVPAAGLAFNLRF